MNLFVAHTDADWYRHLSRLAAAPGGRDEANFWKPSGGANFKALSFGEPLVFKLKKVHGHAVVGFGLLAVSPSTIRGTPSAKPMRRLPSPT